MKWTLKESLVKRSERDPSFMSRHNLGVKKKIEDIDKQPTETVKTPTVVHHEGCYCDFCSSPWSCYCPDCEKEK